MELKIPMVQVVDILGVTERHAWRILAAYRKEGAAALAPGNRGRRPPNAIPIAIASAVATLAGTFYSGANQTLLAELLQNGKASASAAAPCGCSPGEDVPTYSGAQVEMLGLPGGGLRVQHEG